MIDPDFRSAERYFCNLLFTNMVKANSIPGQSGGLLCMNVHPSSTGDWKNTHLHYVRVYFHKNVHIRGSGLFSKQ